MLRTPSRWLFSLPLLAALAAAPGCVQQPAITIHHAEVRGMTPTGLGVIIYLQVRNDNSYDVQVRNVNVNVGFGRSGAVLGPINFAPNQWLPANQTAMVAVPVNVPWTLVPALVTETAGGYSIPYHVVGVADVTATSSLNIQRNNYPVDETGFVPRQMVVDAARQFIPLPLF
jgi:hypothetical protein